MSLAPIYWGMLKEKIKLIRVIAGIFMLLLIYLSYAIFSTERVETIEVLVAKEVIYPRTKITESNTTTVEIPKIYVGGDTLTAKEEILGKYTQIYATVPKDSVFYAIQLEKPENLSDYPSLLLNKDQVSYPIYGETVKNTAGSLVAGQKVDIYVTLNFKDQPPLTGVLIKAVRIIALRDRNGQDLDPAKNKPVYMVSIAVAEDLVKYLKATAKLGTIDIYPVNTNYQDNQESIFQDDCAVLPYLSGEK